MSKVTAVFKRYTRKKKTKHVEV